MYFFKTPGVVKFFYKNAIWNGSREERRIFLTFDDGPVPGSTDRILDILSNYNVKATFFCVGENIKKNPDLFRRIIKEGHLVGNHTMNHLDGWKSKTDAYLQDIADCDAAISKYGESQVIKLFRPPYGRIKRKVLHRLIKKYYVIMWDVLSYDFSKKISAERSLNKSLHHTQNGSIIIFHDSERTEGKTELIISQYINYLVDKNYKFSTFDYFKLRKF